ncbi:MAG: transglycosylase SLT domain-containing protein [Prolixibacteraceae bacterium]|nr:transglycosylase SLT domain-containing protein [Prolixibacteraceae bacterium]
MRKIQLITILLFCFSEWAGAKDFKKDSLNRIRKIEVVSLNDSLNTCKIKFFYPDENLNVLFSDHIDSMLNTWYFKHSFVLSEKEKEAEPLASTSPDSVYVEQLQSIDSYVDLSYNKTVKNFIQLYLIKRKTFTESVIGLSSYYFPMIEEILDKYNLPHELEYMTIIESALNPAIRSRANAVGLWQFMYGTGKMYKLNIGTFVDERCDPVKSTEAAAKYLSDLYKIYNDWHLVIAAYNCGPGNVNKAIRRCGGTHDYWKIYYNLPRETRGYVPAFIAVAYVMNYYKEYGLKPHYPDFPMVTDTIMIHDYLHFNQISKILNIPEDELSSLNPQYRLKIIPAREDKGYPLCLPIDKIEDYIDREGEVYAYNREKLFPNNEIKIPQGRYTHYSTTSVKGKTRILYKIRRGDNLGQIAERYHVRINDLRYWNNIHRSLIREGRKLAIFVPSSKKEVYANLKASSSTEPETSAHSSVTVNNNPGNSDYLYYTVRHGDNLWSIARQFPGISNNDIMQLNQMEDEDIKPGQKLKIRSKA